MSDQETITEEKVEIEESTGNPNVVIVHNDDYNTFDHVINCLISICKMDKQTAEEKTLSIHFKGKAIVAEGDDSYLKKIKLRLKAEGLSVTMERA